MSDRAKLKVYRVTRGRRSKWLVPLVLLVPGDEQDDLMEFHARSSAYRWAKSWSIGVVAPRELRRSDHRGWRRATHV